jgi:hypothetical protein
MQTPEKVIVDDRAWIGWFKLPEAAKAELLEELGKLADQPVDRWAGGAVERWTNGYMFAYHIMVREKDELLVFFRPEEGNRVRIDDMMLKETIDRYFAKTS